MELIKTQKQLKRALFSRKEKLSPKEIFLSLAYKEFLTQMTKGFVSDFAGSSNIYEGAEEVAYTEVLNIFINYNSELARTLSVSDKNILFKGLNLHELGHLLLKITSADRYNNTQKYPYAVKLRDISSAGLEKDSWVLTDKELIINGKNKLYLRGHLSDKDYASVKLFHKAAQANNSITKLKYDKD